MANTYSSWEYSQGPTLYIDSSGFESIDDNKNFIYFYIVTYSPVEYRRKVTDELGNSSYEFKYSFGEDNSSRKILDRYTFSGKNQLTKVVEHTVTEDGFKDTIVKTFVIDTNIKDNLENNKQPVIDPTQVIPVTNWVFNASKTISLPSSFNGVACGWKTQKETGTKTCSYTSYSSGSYWAPYSPSRSIDSRSSKNSRAYNPDTGYDDNGNRFYVSGNYSYIENADGSEYRIHNDTWKVEEKKYYSYSYTSYYTTTYTYDQVYNTYGKINLKNIRNAIGDRKQYCSLCFRLRTQNKLNVAPKVSIDSSTTATSNRKTLTCKVSGEIPSNDTIEFHLPFEYIYNTFSNFDEIYLFLEKDKCNIAECHFYEAYAYIETEVNKIPYINLEVQTYNKISDSWTTACVVPYLNYQEINELRDSKQQISKNLFFPIDLPKTDSTYRMRLDTNLVAKELEMFTNFRLDVLAKQLIPPGSITDHKLFINNDDLEHDTEIEVGEIDEIRLNVLEKEIYSMKTYAGFLKQGANDIHAYLRNTVTPIDDTVPNSNISKNVWYNYISKINGNWVSNQRFVANTFNFSQINILHGDNTNLENELLAFEVPYNNLKPNSMYKLVFILNADEAFKVSGINNINKDSESKVIKSKFITQTEYDTSKLSVNELDVLFYSPAYKCVSASDEKLLSEIDRYERDITCEYIINTKNIDINDNGKFTISFKTKAVKNIVMKNIQCLCIDNDGVKHLDITEPHSSNNIDEGRKYETSLTIYYDGFNLEHINPLLYKDMLYLRQQLDKIREDYTIEPYHWSDWANKTDSKGDLILDKYGHPLGVERNQPLRAIHFNEVKACCVDTYEKLLALKPPVILNTTPTAFRDNVSLIPLIEEDESQGYVLQHVQDKEGNILEIDKYFPEWRKIIEFINRN